MDIWHVVIDSPLVQHFDYLPSEQAPTPMAVGVRVRVPFGQRSVIGIVVGFATHTRVPKKKLRRISEVLDATPVITAPLFDLASFAQQYYHIPLGHILFKMLPPLLRHGRPLSPLAAETAPHENSAAMVSPLRLSEEQHAAALHINAVSQFAPIVLAGITGSGKTEVYLSSIHHQLVKKRQVLLLIPEINLISQTQSRVLHMCGSARILTYHSGLNDLERLQNWQRCFTDDVDIVIGTRSALFLPLARLGLIVVDEEHDPSFKAQDAIRFHARDLAIVRAKQANIGIVLGSATPSLETLYNVECGRFQQMTLTKRPGQYGLPHITLLDIRDQKLKNGLAPALLERITHHLAQNNQVLLFLNRRGFAPVMMCHHCGYVAECTQCDVRLVYHKKSKQLQCHHCSRIIPLPDHCPQCARKQLVPIGQGTERLETFLQTHYPNVMINRIDGDTTKNKGMLEKKLTSVREGHAQILIGTQMLAKGHDFPNLSLVAIIDADAGLYGVDFRATERLGQSLMQVAGRAGRGHVAGEVILQTHHPEHPLLQLLKQHDYANFCQTLLRERFESGLPPYTYLALIRAQAKNKERILDALTRAKLFLMKHENSNLFLLGPSLLPIAKKAGLFRAQLLLQAKTRLALQRSIHQFMHWSTQANAAERVRFAIDIDPVEIF